MKIIRDGKEFELTYSEIMKAHEKYELDCMIDDVKSVYEQGEYDVELSEDNVSEIAHRALRNLSKNDGYFESYWMSVEYTLDDYIDEMYDEDDEDDE